VDTRVGQLVDVIEGSDAPSCADGCATYHDGEHPPAERSARADALYSWSMARPADDLPNDPLLVVVDDEEPTMTFDDWLALLATDEPTEVDADAAEVLREIREHGER
jgi:hypothetical protein